MTASPYTLDTLHTIHEHGGHFLRLIGGDGPKAKQPIGKWKHHKLTIIQLDTAHDAGDLLGLVPWSIGASVLDLDCKGETNGPALIPYLPSPHATSVSLSGLGSHFWYDALPGLTGVPLPGIGDAICQDQYVALTHDDSEAAKLTAMRVKQQFCLPFPTELLPPKATIHTSVEVVEVALEAVEGWWKLPQGIAAVEGARNSTLFRLVLQALSWNHKHWGDVEGATEIASGYNSMFLPPLAHDEVRTVAKSAAGYSARWDGANFSARQRARVNRRWAKVRAATTTATFHRVRGT